MKDYSKGKEYKYGDETGTWQSIKVVEYVIPFPYISPKRFSFFPYLPSRV